MMAAFDRVRPLPLLLISLFIAVAVIDLAHRLRRPPQPLPDLLSGDVLGFEAFEPVIDFRTAHDGPSVEIHPRPLLMGRGWSTPGPGGVWIRGSRAKLELELARGGQPILALECRPAQGQRPVRVLRVVVNGVDCGSLDLAKGRGTYSLELPNEAFREGKNTMTFLLPDREEARFRRRALLLRRFALVGKSDQGGPAARMPPPFEVDLEKRRLTFRSSGRLSIGFTVDDRIDALRMRCRIVGGPGRCEVVVARPQGSGPGLDPETRRVVDSDQAGSGRVRVPLHGRRGEFLLTIEAELDPGPGRLIVMSPELVKDTGSTLRPVAD